MKIACLYFGAKTILRFRIPMGFYFTCIFSFFKWAFNITARMKNNGITQKVK